jgi:hypothetical protein
MIKRRVDGTYEIELNGMPYHVTKDDPLFNETDVWAQEHPGEFIDNDPAVAPQPVDERPFDEQVRSRRDSLLARTDWMVLPDSPYNTETVRAYRQALRDLPQQEGFPWDGPDDPACPWPTLNEEV